MSTFIHMTAQVLRCIVWRSRLITVFSRCLAFHGVIAAVAAAITALATIAVTGAAFAATLLIGGRNDGGAVFVHAHGVVMLGMALCWCRACCFTVYTVRGGG